MDEVRELDWVLDEEHWSVVTDHIVVTLLGVMLDGETARITVTIIGTTLTSNGGEAQEDWGLLTNLIEELGLAEMGYIVSDDTFTVGTSTLGVHNTLWNTLTSEVSELVNQVEVSQDDRTSWTSGH